VTEDATQIPAWLRVRAEAQARHPLVRRPALRNRFASFSGVKRSDAVLDLGCGAGYSAFALASRAQHVTAIDWRPELLASAEKEAKRRRLANITFVQTEPTRLPYPHNSFDVVASAAAIHHLTKPSTCVSEMARVCVGGGTVAIEDVLASEQDIRARYHNRVERLRDRSHQRLLKLSELLALLGQAGLVVRRAEVHDSLREFNEWVGVTRPPLRRTEHIRHLLQGSVEQDLSGLDVQAEDDTFIFTQHVAWVLCENPA
jgi:2-polyprenyl-3-methyl-5-hydroxy-6-metoxy-1,4-benzoquinol methylase